MKKIFSRKPSIELVSSIVLLFFSTFLLLYLLVGAFQVAIETNANASYELHSQRSSAPDGADCTPEELDSNSIKKQKFKNSNWAARIASGNTDDSTAYVLVVLVLFSFSASFLFINHYQKELEEKERKEKLERKEKWENLCVLLDQLE